MTLSENDARTALTEVDLVQRRTREMSAYHVGAPHLIWWGLIWIVGYGAMSTLGPERWGQLWLVLTTIGAAGSTALGVIAARKGQSPARSGHLGRWMGTWGLVAVFCVGLFSLVGPPGPAEAMTLPPLFVGLVYGLMGLWLLPRYLLIAAGIFGASLAGYLFLREHLALVIAAAGGGGLVLSGLWLRSA